MGFYSRARLLKSCSEKIDVIYPVKILAEGQAIFVKEDKNELVGEGLPCEIA